MCPTGSGWNHYFCSITHPSALTNKQNSTRFGVVRYKSLECCFCKCVGIRMFTALYPGLTSLSLICHRPKSKCWGVYAVCAVFHLTIGNVERWAHVNKHAKSPNEWCCCFLSSAASTTTNLSLTPLTLTSPCFSLFLRCFTYNTYSRLSASWQNVKRWFKLLNGKRLKLKSTE